MLIDVFLAESSLAGFFLPRVGSPNHLITSAERSLEVVPDALVLTLDDHLIFLGNDINIADRHVAVR
jgi:hypothetical protein